MEILVSILITEKNPKISKSENFLKKNLEIYFENLFIFRNKEILLADQPIFKFIKKVTFDKS